MMRNSSLGICVLVAAGLTTAGCEQTGRDHAAVGAELLRPFKSGLQAALAEGLAAGPVEAIRVCRTQAPEIAERHANGRVRMGRTSHRLRNPSNSAPDWVAPILNDFLADEEDRTPRAVKISRRQLGYVEPIVMQPMCLTCHGEELEPAVAARIRELYPRDQAVGFQTGDLRGVFWAEFPAKM